MNIIFPLKRCSTSRRKLDKSWLREWILLWISPCAEVLGTLNKCWQEKNWEWNYHVSSAISPVCLEMQTRKGEEKKTPLSSITPLRQKLNRNQAAGGWGVWQCCRILRIRTIFWTYSLQKCCSYYVPVCQTARSTEQPQSKWQRLKLACSWFVQYDERIMLLHVYWVFSRIVRGAFHNQAE